MHCGTERERERYGECHKKSSPAQEESDSESTGPEPLSV